MSSSSSSSPSLLTTDQVAFYRENGYIVLRDLFSQDELDMVTKSGETLTKEGRKGSFFSVILKGAMYKDKAFRSLAMKSKMPLAVAELMELDPQTQNLRILRYVQTHIHILLLLCGQNLVLSVVVVAAA